MSKLILTLLTALCIAGPVQAASVGVPWDKFPMDRLGNTAALQNGARLFANHCLNCHGAEFMRYNRLRDIGLSEQQIADNLILTGAKVGETMKVSLDPKDAKDWFGGLPPDLTLIARSRSDASKGSGADYVYTFLRTDATAQFLIVLNYSLDARDGVVLELAAGPLMPGVYAVEDLLTGATFPPLTVGEGGAVADYAVPDLAGHQALLLQLTPQ